MGTKDVIAFILFIERLTIIGTDEKFLKTIKSNII